MLARVASKKRGVARQLRIRGTATEMRSQEARELPTARSKGCPRRLGYRLAITPRAARSVLAIHRAFDGARCHPHRIARRALAPFGNRCPCSQFVAKTTDIGERSRTSVEFGPCRNSTTVYGFGRRWTLADARPMQLEMWCPSSGVAILSSLRPHAVLPNDDA